MHADLQDKQNIDYKLPSVVKIHCIDEIMRTNSFSDAVCEFLKSWLLAYSLIW